MIYLTFDTQQDAEAALIQVNTAYGCLYTEQNYFMEKWDNVVQVNDKWGFTRPEARCGKTPEEVIAAITPAYEEIEAVIDAD